MEWVDVVRSGEPSPGSPYEAPCFRIPALAVSGSRLVLAYDVREDWRDLPGPFDVMVRTSDDLGRTWTAPVPLRRHEGGTGFGDASLIADGDDVWCWYVSSDGPGFFTATTEHGLGLWLAHSADGGRSWTHRDLSALRPGGVAGMFATSGNGIVLSTGPAAGRLLQPFVVRTGDRRSAVVAASDDRGVTWRLGEPVGPDCDETKVVETPTGVLLLARDRPRRRTAISADGLTYRTAVPHPDLVDPGCNGGAVRLADGRLVASLLDDESDRRRLVLRLSHDDGLTWPGVLVVDPGAAAYSVLAVLPDGSLGLAYEVGDYAAIRFCRVPLAELAVDAAGRPLLAPLPATPGTAKPPVAGAAPSADPTGPVRQDLSGAPLQS